jgi:hypothetical protein
VPVDLTIYNGPKGKSWLIRFQSDSPFSLDLAMQGKLTKVSQPGYGQKMTVDVPQEFENSARLKTLQFQVQKTVRKRIRQTNRFRTIPYIGIGPCPDGELSFQSVHYFYLAIQPVTATDTDNCG